MVFPNLLQSEMTVLALINDKHTGAGPEGIYAFSTMVFSWLSGGSKGVLVIVYYFIIYF